MRNSLARLFSRFAMIAIVAVFTIPTASFAASFTLQVDADGVERINAPVTLELTVPEQISAEHAAQLKQGGLALFPGNLIVDVETVADAEGKITTARLHWVEPAMKADEKKTYQVDLSKLAAAPSRYAFADTESTRDLKLGDQFIWRHDVLKYDPEKHTETYKHFHQLYGMHDDGFITQGVGGKQFPHHRGLYMGWSKTGFEGKSYDTWHCSKGVALKHREFLTAQKTAGNVIARSVSVADWTTGEGKTIVTEQRSVTTWQPAKGFIVLDMHFTLTSGGGDVKLDGDPQHAGFQFRAHGDVGTKTKYIYASGALDKRGDVWANCAWVVNQFPIKNNRYAVAHFDHPANPGTASKETVYSTRNYGRFGSYAKHDLKEGSPLEFNYRVLVIDTNIHDGKTQADYQKLYEAWLKPVKVTMAPAN